MRVLDVCTWLSDNFSWLQIAHVWSSPFLPANGMRQEEPMSRARLHCDDNNLSHHLESGSHSLHSSHEPLGGGGGDSSAGTSPGLCFLVNKTRVINLFTRLPWGTKDMMDVQWPVNHAPVALDALSGGAVCFVRRCFVYSSKQKAWCLWLNLFPLTLINTSSVERVDFAR